MSGAATHTLVAASLTWGHVHVTAAAGSGSGSGSGSDSGSGSSLSDPSSSLSVSVLVSAESNAPAPHAINTPQIKRTNNPIPALAAGGIPPPVFFPFVILPIYNISNIKSLHYLHLITFYRINLFMIYT
jgi:hypothetical protein